MGGAELITRKRPGSALKHNNNLNITATEPVIVDMQQPQPTQPKKKIIKKIIKKKNADGTVENQTIIVQSKASQNQELKKPSLP